MLSKPRITDFQDVSRFYLVESFSVDDMKVFLLRELGLNPSADKKPVRLTVKSRGGCRIFRQKPDCVCLRAAVCDDTPEKCAGGRHAVSGHHHSFGAGLDRLAVMGYNLGNCPPDAHFSLHRRLRAGALFH